MASFELFQNSVISCRPPVCRFILTAITFVVAIFLSACATPYQPAGFSGGYTDFETQPGIYYVSFKGNGYTSKAKGVGPS